MPTAQQEIEDLPAGGLIYEPASLWSIAAVDVSLGEPQLVRFNREHFFNGTPYPITLTRVAMSGINYSLEFGAPPGARYQSNGSVMSTVRIAITPPFRQHYSRQPIVVNSVAPWPTGTPRARPAPAGAPTFEPSSAFGLTALNFDFPMYVPRKVLLQWDISAIQAYEEQTLAEARVHMLWQEENDIFFNGNARTFDFQAQNLIVSQYFPAAFDAAILNQYQDRWPYIPDGVVGVYAGGDTPDFWDTQGSFTAKRFREQDAVRAGSAKITGMRVMIDQIDTDDRAGPQRAPGILSQASMRVGCRAMNASARRKWWRDGAPLGLVLDTLTPATVVKLPYPITLAPWDTLEVEALFPEVPNFDDEYSQQMQFGISFNGHRAIEG